MGTHRGGPSRHPISTTNHQIRVCICGQPFKPNIGGVRSGRTGNLSVTGVMDSIEKAIGSRAQIPGMIEQMAGNLVSREEFLALMDGLMKRLDALETPVTSSDTPTTKPALQSAAAKKAAEKAAKAAEATPEAK